MLALAKYIYQIFNKLPRLSGAFYLHAQSKHKHTLVHQDLNFSLNLFELITFYNCQRIDRNFQHGDFRILKYKKHPATKLTKTLRLWQC
jgi:hypothetical protein